MEVNLPCWGQDEGFGVNVHSAFSMCVHLPLKMHFYAAAFERKTVLQAWEQTYPSGQKVVTVIVKWH